MSNQRRNVKRGFVVFFVIALVAYGLFQSKKLIEGPQITVSEPQDGATVTENLITIRGVAKNIAYIKLNDTAIFVDNDGQFSEQLVVPEGYSTIKLTVQDKFGKIREQFIHVNLPQSLVHASSTPQQPTHATSTATSTL